MKNALQKMRRALTWVTVEEACADDGDIAWYKKVARRLGL